MCEHDLSTVIGYTSQWHPQRNSISIELAILGGERRELGELDFEQANALITMLTRNGKKSISYKDGKYLQVSEFYQYK